MKNKGFFKLYVILTVLGFLSYTTTVAQINENFQSWTSRGSYGTYTQAGSGGTWNMVQCIVSPTGASSGVGSTGFVQLQSANGILTLPNIVSGGVGTISVDARVSGANGGFSIQKSINNGAWTNVQTYTSSSTTGVNFTATVNDASANLRLRINNTGGSGNRALYVYDVVTTVAVVPCTSPDRIEFATQPTSGQNIQQGVTIPLVVKAVCGAGGATDTGLNTGSVTIALNTGKCGLRNSGTSVTTITANFVNGVATFSNVTIGRSTQSGLTFTTTNTQSLTNATTNSFNITAPGSGTPTNTTIASEDFEGGTTWAYSIGTPSYSGSGGGTDATGVKTISSNNVMAKSYSTNNASDEKKSTNTVTFTNQTISGTYNYATFGFQLASLGSGTGAGNDNGDDMSIQISLNNGSTWNTLLTYFGNSDYLIPFSGSSVSLAYNANAQYTRPATQSTFSVQLPTGTTQFMFRMTGTNNRTNENWCIDNITLIGTAIPVNNPSPLPTANGGTISTCPNTNNTLTVTTANTVGTITYAWSPTTNMNPPAGNISNPVVNPPGNTVYSVTVTDADNCKATATRTISVPGGAAGTWTGVVDNDWFQCRNWGNGVVPTTTTNVTIPNGIINIATIDPQSSFATPFSGIAYSNNLTINSGGKLIGIYGSNLRVSGNWNNNGIFNPGDGTVNFTGGSGTATINGSAAQAFNSIAINKSVQLLTDASVSSIGTLAVNNTLDLNAKTLTVLNATNTAITRTAPGYVLSEEQDGSARLLWSINSFSYIDDYIFPMGNAAGNYIPVTFKLNSGDIGFAGVATYKSTGALASNWPTGTETVTNVTNPAQAVQRFWHLESDQPANNYNADVTFTYPTAEDPTLGAGVNVQFQRYNKPTNTWDFPLVTQTYSPNATRSVLVEGITKFSWWGGGNDNTNPLPVELVSFKGNCNANTVTITWETATETNNDYFTIQRSRNLIEYEDVAIVQGSGNSNTLKAYSVTDENPLTGTSYYRLLQTDFNGEYEVFNSIAVGCADNGIATITVYPNPATSVLNIQVNNGATGKGFITLYNQLGQRVITEGISTSVGINTYTINTDNLPAGQYFVQFVMDNTALPVQKIVITD